MDCPAAHPRSPRARGVLSVTVLLVLAVILAIQVRKAVWGRELATYVDPEPDCYAELVRVDVADFERTLASDPIAPFLIEVEKYVDSLPVHSHRRRRLTEDEMESCLASTWVKEAPEVLPSRKECCGPDYILAFRHTSDMRVVTVVEYWVGAEEVLLNRHVSDGPRLLLQNQQDVEQLLSSIMEGGQ